MDNLTLKPSFNVYDGVLISIVAAVIVWKPHVLVKIIECIFGFRINKHCFLLFIVFILLRVLPFYFILFFFIFVNNKINQGAILNSILQIQTLCCQGSAGTVTGNSCSVTMSA